MTLFGQEVEFINFAFIEKDFTKVPLHAFVDEAVTDTQTIANFKRALGKTYGATAKADLVVIIYNDDGDVTLGEINRRTKPDRTCPDNHYGVMRWGSGILIGMVKIRIKRSLEYLIHACKASHI